jgi:hypothetical protein
MALWNLQAPVAVPLSSHRRGASRSLPAWRRKSTSRPAAALGSNHMAVLSAFRSLTLIAGPGSAQESNARHTAECWEARYESLTKPISDGVRSRTIAHALTGPIWFHQHSFRARTQARRPGFIGFRETGAGTLESNDWQLAPERFT